MNPQDLILTGFRVEPEELSNSRPSFDLVREKLAGFASKFYEGEASDLRKFSIERHNQINSSSCVAQSIVKAAEIKRIIKLYREALSQGLSEAEALAFGMAGHVDLSRLALYYLARELMDPPETDKDQGTYISSAAEALRSFGVCRENPDPKDPNDRAYWPFNLGINPKSGRPQMFEAPTWAAMREAYLHKIDAWYKITNRGDYRIRDIILALASQSPVVYGTAIDNQWHNYDGSQPIKPAEGRTFGFHATCLVGWDPLKQVFIGENSWGPGWGLNGFYEVTPEKLSSNMDSNDFVVIEGGWEPWKQAA